MHKYHTNEDLFQIVLKILEDKKLLPDHLDYCLPETGKQEIQHYGFDIVGNVTYGGSEGIYLAVFLHGITDKSNQVQKLPLGTFKTLRTDRSAFYDMAKLMADFTIEGTAYVNKKIDEFDWKEVEKRK